MWLELTLRRAPDARLCRYLLTKGSTQAQVRLLPCLPPDARRRTPSPAVVLTPSRLHHPLHQLLADTGASVVTKGTWLPDKSKATAADPPLYLHVVAHTKEILDKALAEVRTCPPEQPARGFL